MAIAIIFSVESAELETMCRDLHRKLGVTTHELGLLEARRRGVSFRECVRSSRAASEINPADVERVCQSLGPLLKEQTVTELIAPASMVHIDHAITRMAAERLFDSGNVARIGFQADQPYVALWPDSLDLRALRVSPETGAASRDEVAVLLETLALHVGRRDVARILSSYGQAPQCQIEPVYFPSTDRSFAEVDYA